MERIMPWYECKQKHIRKIEYDKYKLDSIREFVETKIELTEKIELNEKNASVLIVDYYDIIKELLIALLLKNGLKSNNHECLISYFKANFPEMVYESGMIHKIKNIRNKISYEGYRVKLEFIKRNIYEIKNIISVLKTKIMFETTQE